jgi:hypothetical protein
MLIDYKVKIDNEQVHVRYWISHLLGSGGHVLIRQDVAQPPPLQLSMDPSPTSIFT